MQNMAPIRLTGTLICTTAAERTAVLAALPDHIHATVSEPGCLFFDVCQSDDPMLWNVDEGFVDRAAFRAHQTRASTSDWARATAGIRRDYKTTEQRPEIAQETAQDAAAISLLLHAAFLGDEEANLVNALRLAFDLPISLTAKLGPAYLGYIAFSPMNAPFKAVSLAPLAVSENMRRQGLGADLVRAGLLLAREKGFEGVFVLGDPEFYGRFGFKSADKFTGTFAGEHLMVLDLTRKGLPDQGAITWAPAFKTLT
jgi:predicted N-acetyltransferase YhbS/quinol monooxygenase YgiN